jgi:SAM-dependent methyltransferase
MMLYMSISADEERRYYDRTYTPLLELPDHALRLDRHILLADMDNPRKTIYERRRLFHLTFDYLDRLPLRTLNVLDYGCGPAEWGVWMATEGARVTFLDLSPAAIELALRRAAASGCADRVRGEARDASDLRGFADGEFDLIFGSAAVHHTLKYANAFEELLRVLKPGGRLVLAETLSVNPVLNLARRLCAPWTGLPTDAGEEIILGRTELELLHRHFQSVEVSPVNLLGMAKRLLRGRFAKPASKALLGTLEVTDSALLAMLPFLGKYCGEALIVSVR